MSQDDLESYWQDVRAELPALSRVPDVKELLGDAAVKAATALAAKYRWLTGKPLDIEMLGQMIGDGVHLFLEHWYSDLRRKPTSELITMVLEGQDLTPEEMKGFVRALPLSLLVRVVQTEGIVAPKGIHALLAVEHHHRNNPDERDYQLARSPEGKLRVTVYPVRLHGEALEFSLDETFQQA